MNLKFTVLLSVYSKESANNLNQCLNSIWNETTLKPDQIVLVEDGPLNEELYSCIKEWKLLLGETLEIINLEINSGLARALNIGLMHCKYELVARMDTDDISLSNRFKAQIEFFKKNPKTSVLSGQIEEWNSSMSQKISSRNLPTEHEKLVKFAKFRSPINHPAVMFRKSDVLASGGYPEIYPEDFMLWHNMLSRGYIFRNLSETLVKMRTGSDFLNRRGLKFLKGEIFAYKKLLERKKLSKIEYIYIICLKVFVRTSPKFLKAFFYKNLR